MNLWLVCQWLLYIDNTSEGQGILYLVVTLILCSSLLSSQPDWGSINDVIVMLIGARPEDQRVPPEFYQRSCGMVSLQLSKVGCLALNALVTHLFSLSTMRLSCLKTGWLNLARQWRTRSRSRLCYKRAFFMALSKHGRRHQ